MANFFDRFDAPAPQREDQQRNFFDQFDEQQEKKQPNFFDKFDEARPVAEPAPREQAIPPSQPEESSFIRQALDVPLGITKGAVSGFRMIADAFGAGNFASEAIKSSEKYLEGLMSAQSRNDSEEVSRIMQDAEDKGFGDQVRAAIKAFAVAPVDLVSQALGTAAPVILGGLATTVLRGGALAASTVTTGLAGTTGAGLIKGNIYDAVKEEMIKAGDSPDVAEKKAQEAQAYGGKNLDMILAGTALGALAGRTGVEKLILNKIAGKEAAEQGLLRRAGEGAVTEAAPEFVQAGQEALATNVALQREGFDVPTMRGVVGQATLEGLAGSALGATTGALSKPRVAADTAEDKAIAALDKLVADEEAEELKLEESILARANEIIGEFSDDGQTISMDDAYARARFELVEDKPQAATSGLVGETDLFAEEAVGRIPAAEIVPATKEELKKIDKDLKKKLGRVPTTAEVGKAIDDFEQEKTRRLRAESGGRKPPVSVPSGEEAAAGVTGAPARTEPTGLGESVGAAASVGTRKEPTTGALKPEDTIVYKDVASPTGITQAGNVTLQNYFKTYYGLPAESLPKAAATVMPLLQRAENLLQRFGAVYSESNQPFVDTDSSQKYKHRAARSPEYSEAYKHHPGGILRKLTSSAMAVDKDYKTANPEQLAKDVANFEERLNKFEEAIAKLPPPLTSEERQAKEAAFESKQAPAITSVSERRQLEALVSLLRKEPQRLAKAPVKGPLYTPARSDPARLQEAIDAGLITQEELDKLQKQSDDFFAEEPTAPTEEGGATVLDATKKIEAKDDVQTRTVYRTGPSGMDSLGRDITAADVIRYEQEELGNKDLRVVTNADLSKIPARKLEWVTFNRKDAEQYLPEDIGPEDAEYLPEITSREETFRVLAQDSDGGYLIERVSAAKAKEEPTQTYEEALAENYKRRGLDNPDEVSKKIQESRNVSKKVADDYVQALRKRDEERIKWSYGLGSEQAFREALGEVEKIENRIRGVEKRREGRQPPSTKPTAPVEEPIRFRTVNDLSPEDRAAYESENAEIRASMREATDAAKERGIPFPNAAAPFVDQLRALDQSYGLGERISEGQPEIRGVRPARDEDEVQTPGTDPVGFARVQAANSFDRRNSLDYSDPEEAIDFGLDNLNDTLTEYGVTDPYIREQAVEAYKNEIARLQNEAAGIRPATDLDAELEQKAIELSLKVGDIHPTIVSAISNNDLNGALRIASQKLSGFSADLAKALLDLKLPTNISFNSGRDLVRRSIDNLSRAEQGRLFRYVQMHYPQVYDKYFKNYDRSESLEAVSEGLAELQKPNYKLGPVIAEFETVSGAYKKYIEGLTAPGAYYPEFDEIALDANTRTGKSYRVFLHEVVHAATEYVLDTFGRRPQDLTPGQRAAAEELTKMYNYAVEKLGKTPYGMTNIYEFVAEVFTNKKFQDLLKGLKYEPKKTPFLSRLVKAILRAFGLDNLAGNAMAEATKIFSAVRTGVPLARGPRFAKGGSKTPRIRGPISQTWRTAEDVARSAVEMLSDAIKGRRKWEGVLEDIRDSMWDTKTGVFRRAVLGFANLRQIDDLTKTKFPQIAAAIRMIEQMLAYRGNIMKSAENITKKWTEAKAKNPKQDRLMSRIMIEATIRGLDPDRPGAKQMNAALVQAWNQLDPEFKQIYREVRDFYATAVNNMVREMKLKVAKSTMTLTEKKAAIREINDKFGPDKLVQPYFPLRRFGKYWFQVGERNFKEFYEFEDQFSRELAMRSRIRDLKKGNAQQKALAETVRKGNGLSELFSQNRTATGIIQEVQNIVDSIGDTQLAPTQEQYNRAERALKKELNRTPTRDEVLKRFEKDATKQELKDSLNQMLYILLPQQSMRKMFINRKAIQGASSDMLRVFATSAVHSAYQQSRFKYAEAFLNNLSTAIDYVEEFADRDRAAMYREYIAEVEKRASTILSNEDTSLTAKAAGRASELTFFYMLSAPFSAMLNLLGVGAITMPYIGGRYGYAKTNALMIKNFGRYLATSPSRTFMPLAKGNIMQAQFPSIAEGGQLTGVLKKAADRFIEEGQINISLTNDLMDMGERPSELYTGRYNMVKKMLSGLFHQSERLGREVSLLTTFELAYDKFSKSPKKDLRGVIERDAQGNPIMNTPDEAFELAISEAKDIVGLSLGDFTRQMKPRYFTPPLLSVLTKFKQYSVLATYAVVRNFYFTVAAPFRKKEIEEFRQQMLKDKISPQVIDQRVAEAEAQRKELYREGRRRLAGILGVTYLLGGNEASPFYSIGLGTLIKLLANEDDDEFFDWENWLKNYMEEELGGAAGDMFAELGMDPKTADKAGRFVGGSLQRGLVAEITGGELASRVSLDPKNLWYREGRYSPDVRESIVEDVIANAGPVVGLGFNWIDAYKLFQEGQYQRAFEKAAPALVSKPVAATRIAEEDARTASGIRLADNFSAWELSMLSVGLQPTRLAQAQKSAIEAKQYSEKVKDRRATLLDRLWMERDNADGFNETLEKIKEFSQKYPNHRIEPKDILESFERRGENQAIAEAIGGQFEKKSIPQALQMLRYGRE